jgi:hypothetical protein
MAITDIKCRRIDKKEIWDIAERVREDYWPESILPVDAEKIAESRLHLIIDPLHDLRRATDMDAYLTKDRKGITVDYDTYMDDRYINRLRFSL